MLLRLVPALLCLWLAAGASAASLDGVTFPERYPVGGQSLVLNGMGLRTLTIFGVRIYVAGLYLPEPSHDAQQILASSGPKVLLLQYLHSGSKAQVENQYRAGETTNCGAGGCAASDQADFERLVAAAPAVDVGDTTTYIFTGKGVQVFANRQLIGDFANQDLAHLLLAGFIGDHPPSPELKDHLLGLGGN